MRFCYLVQGAARLLAEFPYPRGRDVLVASYDRVFDSRDATETHYIPGTTWAEGRNLLAEAARRRASYDYYVFCDDDARFERGDLAQFEASLSATRPLVGLPLMSRAARKGVRIANAPVQRALVIDEQVMAIHASLVGRTGIMPLVTDYDRASWWIACRISQSILVRDHHPFVHQYNNIVVRNDVHRFKGRSDAIDGGASTYVAPTDGLDTDALVADWFKARGESFEAGQLKALASSGRGGAWRQLRARWRGDPAPEALARDWRAHDGGAVSLPPKSDDTTEARRAVRA